jgi:hypothetical protein
MTPKGKPYTRSTIANDIRTLRGEGRIVKEIIGRYTYVKPIWAARVLLNVDKLQSDYVFWDHLRRGKAKGYELGGLFCAPIIRILTSYIFSTGFTASIKARDYHLEDEKGNVVSEANKKPTTVLPNVTNRAPTPGNAKAAGSGRMPATAGQPQANPKASGAQGAPGGPGMPPPPPPPEVKEDPQIQYTNQILRDMVQRNQPFFQQTVTDLMALGDQYVVINADSSFSLASPETVTVEYSPADYRIPVRYIIRSKLERAIVTDVYTAERRSTLIHYLDGRPDVINHYENLLHEIPIVHFANDRSTNEIYGRPIYEAALPLMSRYDDLLQKTMQGVEIVANPIPTFEGMADIQETVNANLSKADENYTGIAGETETREVLNFDRMPAIFVGQGGSFAFKSPNSGFTTDITNTLNHLFTLLLQHVRIPQFVWGGQMTGSRSSTESQLPPFVEEIKYRRLQLTGATEDPEVGIAARGGFSELFSKWLRMRALLNPGIMVAPVEIQWPTISTVNEMVRLQYMVALLQAGLLSPKTAIEVSGLVNDAELELSKVQHTLPPDFSKYEDRIDTDLLDEVKRAMNEDGYTGEVDSVLSSVTTVPGVSMTGADLQKLNLDNTFNYAAPALWVGVSP